MSGHTPGDWVVDFDVIRVGDIDVLAANSQMILAHVYCRHKDDSDNPPRETAIANARLIAVAPDLYDAVKVILAGFEKGVFVRNTDNDHDPMWLLGIAVQIAALAKAQQAIARAEGRS